jgi:hypothetical protein
MTPTQVSSSAVRMEESLAATCDPIWSRDRSRIINHQNPRHSRELELGHTPIPSRFQLPPHGELGS